MEALARLARSEEIVHEEVPIDGRAIQADHVGREPKSPDHIHVVHRGHIREECLIAVLPGIREQLPRHVDRLPPSTPCGQACQVDEDGHGDNPLGSLSARERTAKSPWQQAAIPSVSG